MVRSPDLSSGSGEPGGLSKTAHPDWRHHRFNSVRGIVLTNARTLRTASIALLITGALGAVLYLVARNAQWHERAVTAERSAGQVAVLLADHAARIRTTLGVADSLRTALVAATVRAHTDAGRSLSQRRALDAVRGDLLASADSVAARDSVIAMQDRVIASQDSLITDLNEAVVLGFRTDSANVAAIALLQADRVTADTTIARLRQVIREAPVVQAALPKRSFWRGVALGVAGAIVLDRVLPKVLPL